MTKRLATIAWCAEPNVWGVAVDHGTARARASRLINHVIHQQFNLQKLSF